MKIKFMPQNVEVDVDPSKSLLKIATEAGLKIKSICGGIASCGECRVKIIEGDNSIPEPGKPELNLIGTSYYLDGRRLSCQVRCFGSVTVDLTEQINKVDTQKKVRGFKSKDTKELSAVQDTMILSNKKPEPPSNNSGQTGTENSDEKKVSPVKGRNNKP